MTTKPLGTIATTLGTLPQTPAMVTRINAILDAEKPSLEVIRAGEVRPELSGLAAAKVDISWTYIAAVAQVLRHHKTAVEPCDERRFQRLETNVSDDDHIAGYAREDWSRAFFIAATFFNMRKPKYAVDGATGPSGTKLGVAWVQASEEKKILDDGDDDRSYDNTNFREVVEFFRSYGQTLEVADKAEAGGRDPSRWTATEDRSDTLTTRLNYLIGVNPTISLSSAIQKKKRDRNMPEAAPASVPAIRDMLAVLQGDIGEPDIAGTDGKTAELFQNVMSSQGLHRFMATQSHMAESLATAKSVQTGDTFDDTHIATVGQIKEAFALDQFLSRFQPQNVDFKAAVAALGLDPENWSDLAINPDNPDFTLMPHQVASELHLPPSTPLHLLPIGTSLGGPRLVPIGNKSQAWLRATHVPDDPEANLDKQIATSCA